MKTFYEEAAVIWHQQILDINKQADPIAYRPKPKNLSKAWRSKAASISDRKHARDVPRIVPSYNATSHHSAAYGRTQRALLSALKADSHSAFNPITSDDEIVILDSGCSIAITPDLSDFIDGTYAAQDNQISGIGSGLNSTGIGEVNWSFIDNDDKPITMKLTCLHVPDIPCRLLPPQQIAQQLHGIDSTCSALSDKKLFAQQKVIFEEDISKKLDWYQRTSLIAMCALRDASVPSPGVLCTRLVHHR